MQTRIIHTKLWRDGWFVNLSNDAKFLWVYLLTNDKINICGIYEITDREIIFDTSIDTSILDKIKKELEPKAIFYKGYVKVANAEKYNNYRNSPKNEIAYNRELSRIPKDVLDTYGIDTSIHTSIHTPINKKSEKGNKIAILEDEETWKELSEKFEVSKEYIQKECEKMKDWLKANGKRQKDYKAFARNWIRKGLESGGEGKVNARQHEKKWNEIKEKEKAKYRKVKDGDDYYVDMPDGSKLTLGQLRNGNK